MRPRSGSSSALSLTAERTRSPKSCGAKPGIVVSRSTTQSASPLRGVEQHVGDLGVVVDRPLVDLAAPGGPVSAAASARRSSSAATASRVPATRPLGSSRTIRSKAASRAGVSWKPGIVAWSFGAGRSASCRSKRPKARAASYASASLVALSSASVPSIHGTSRQVSPRASSQDGRPSRVSTSTCTERAGSPSPSRAIRAATWRVIRSMFRTTSWGRWNTWRLICCSR